ncbi:hypothetical protein TBLA_0A08020 [Henningerozyma blattae CBS 6284]|uniref:Uncharacterized protein n=1 Tax=Henningerozyma blattae (strain ATCC 34711 / CBS 6284 / DSM 70876 / NBRC 10599 / NRRL Y-10934 / UCD 77-7) TaxID=1071380 RepID=I2GWU0_HENB6|nr:hypothetical protein TBLA_0A08020 [Tetrapisispora blattae CBS 6284]CCH58592.1 hypothetical protein TBLA_0A08020 [Tetrapisispora blattae CBS 6284]
MIIKPAYPLSTAVTTVAGFHTVSRCALQGRIYKNVLANAPPKDYEIKQLLKPVGVSQGVLKNGVTRGGNGFLDMFNKSKVTKRTAELEKEYTHSGFYGLHVFEQTKGKVFLAPKGPWAAPTAQYFPPVKAKVMFSKNTTEKNAPTLQNMLQPNGAVVALFSSQNGASIVSSWIKEIQNYMNRDNASVENSENLKLPVIYLNMIDGALPSLLLQAFGKKHITDMCNNTTDNINIDYFLIGNKRQLSFTIQEQLRINNNHTGYIFILDKNQKVRWLASGPIDHPLTKTSDGDNSELKYFIFNNQPTK